MYGYKCPTLSACKHLWKCAVEQQYFFTFVCLFFSPSKQYVQAFIHPSIHSSICPSIHPIHPSIHPPVHAGWIRPSGCVYLLCYMFISVGLVSLIDFFLQTGLWQECPEGSFRRWRIHPRIQVQIQVCSLTHIDIFKLLF